MSGINRAALGLGAVGTVLTASVTRPILGLGMSIVGMASDSSEALSAVTNVFGTAAAGVIQHSQGAATAVGLSQTQYLSATTQLAAYGNMMGLTQQQTASFADQTVSAAADLASFYNTSPEDALGAINAGFRGEGDALERYGIIMNQATVEAYALEQGIWDGAGAMTNAQLVQARSGYIMSQLTSDTGSANAALGDFTETSGGLANQQRILTATAKDVGAQFGQVLLPIALKMVGGFAKVLGVMADLSPTAKTVVVVIGAIAAAAGPLLIVFGSLLGAVSAVGGALGTGGLVGAFTALLAPIALLIAAGVAFYAAYRSNFLGFADLVDSVFGGAKDVISGFVGGVKHFIDTFRSALDAITGPITEVRTATDAFGNSINVAVKVGERATTLTAIFTSIAEAIRGIGGGNIGVFNVIADAIDTVISTLNRLQFAFALAKAGGADNLHAAISALTGVFPKLKGPITLIINVVNTLKQTVGDLVEQFGFARTEGLDPVRAAFAALGEVFSPLHDSFRQMGEVVSDLVAVFSGLKDALFAAFSGDWSGVLDGLRDAFSAMGDYLWDVVRLWGEIIVDVFNMIDWGAVGTALLDGATAAFGLLTDAAGGLWDFIADSVSAIDFGAIGGLLMDGLRGVLDGLGELADWTLSVGLPTLGGAILSLASGAWDWITGQVPGLLSLAGDILDWTLDVGMPALGGAILDFAGDLWGWVKEGAAWLASALSPTLPDFDISVPLPGIIGDIINAFTDVWGFIRSLVPWLPGGETGAPADDLSIDDFDIAVPTPGISGTIVGAFTDMWGFVTDKVSWLTDTVSGVVNSFDLSSGVPAVGGAIVGAFGSMWDWIRAGVAWLSDTVSGIFQSFDLSSGIPAIGGAIVGAFGSMWEWIRGEVPWLAAIVDCAVDAFTASVPVPEIAGAVVGAYTDMCGWVHAKVSWLSDTISDVVDGFDISSGIPSISGAIVGAFTDLWGWVQNQVPWLSDPNVQAALQSFDLSSGIPAIGGAIVNAYTNIWEWAKAGASWLSDTWTAALEIGANVASGVVSVAADFVSNIMSGIAAGAGWLWDNTAGRFTSNANVEISASASGVPAVGSNGQEIAPPPLSASEITAFAQAYTDAQISIRTAIQTMMGDVLALKNQTIQDTTLATETTAASWAIWFNAVPPIVSLAAGQIMAAVSTMKLGVVADTNDATATMSASLGGWVGSAPPLVAVGAGQIMASISTMKIGVVADTGDMVNTTIATAGAWSTGMTGIASGLDASVRGSISQMKVGIVADVRDAVNTSIAEFGRIGREGAGAIDRAAGSIGASALNAGAMAALGVSNGIDTYLYRVTNSVNAIVSEVNRALRAGLRVASPSRLTAYYGEMTTEGYAKGITSSLSSVTSAVGAMVGTVTDGLSSLGGIRDIVAGIDAYTGSGPRPTGRGNFYANLQGADWRQSASGVDLRTATTLNDTMKIVGDSLAAVLQGGEWNSDVLAHLPNQTISDLTQQIGKALAPFEGQANVFESAFRALKNLIGTGSDGGAFANVFDPVEADLTKLANLLRGQFDVVAAVGTLPGGSPSSPAPTTTRPQNTYTLTQYNTMTVSVKDAEEMVRLSRFVDDLPQAMSIVFGNTGGSY